LNKAGGGRPGIWYWMKAWGVVHWMAMIEFRSIGLSREWMVEPQETWMKYSLQRPGILKAFKKASNALKKPCKK
jgi:hypothetical protein